MSRDDNATYGQRRAALARHNYDETPVILAAWFLNTRSCPPSLAERATNGNVATSLIREYARRDINEIRNNVGVRSPRREKGEKNAA